MCRCCYWKLKALLRIWREQKYIDNPTFKYLCITSPNIVGAYALPNIQYSFQIHSCLNQESLSKFLQSILIKGLNEGSHHSIKEFASVPWFYEELVSLDVISLFTSIINSFKASWTHFSKFTNIPLQEFVIALNLPPTSTYFVSNQNNFLMGSKPFPLFAEIV